MVSSRGSAPLLFYGATCHSYGIGVIGVEHSDVDFDYVKLEADAKLTSLDVTIIRLRLIITITTSYNILCASTIIL